MFISSTTKITILRLLPWDGLRAGSAFVRSNRNRKLLSKITAGRLSCQRLLQMGYVLRPTAWGPSTDISSTTSAGKKFSLLHKQRVTTIMIATLPPQVNLLEKTCPVKPGLLYKWFVWQSFFETSIWRYYFYNKINVWSWWSYTEQSGCRKRSGLLILGRTQKKVLFIVF